MKTATVLFLAIACTLVLSGCARTPKTSADLIDRPIQEMRQAVWKHVVDPGRETRLLALVDELDGVLREHSQDIRAFSDDLGRLNADYDVTREAIDKAVADFSQRARVRRERVLDLHFQMTALTSPAEWKPISKHEVEALGAARSYLTN